MHIHLPSVQVCDDGVDRTAAGHHDAIEGALFLAQPHRAHHLHCVHVPTRIHHQFQLSHSS